ncbi:Hypothetical predicted protein [Octopus vulgaris]|uniref:Uncharacterized protein n=1 Tax=Octopus vulgaris TaxID=6645 RepID=A0AA36B6D6_OCTVU|nr:Hypothetical predicted protein [Octopus vulgaris]
MKEQKDRAEKRTKEDSSVNGNTVLQLCPLQIVLEKTWDAIRFNASDGNTAESEPHWMEGFITRLTYTSYID